MGEILLRVQNLSKYYQMGEVTVSLSCRKNLMMH
jgi:hypothetical protein